MIHSHTEIISAENFLNNVKNDEAAFLVIINQSNLSEDSHVIHVMNVISESSISEKLSLFREYENYINIFSAEKIMKQNELKNVKHSINLIFEKNSFYRSIYNLSVQKLSVL